jgi:hypothetical protein
LLINNFALCLYGKFNNRLNSSSGINGYNYINQNLLQKYPFDVFVYSNDIRNSKMIHNLYARTAQNLVVEAGKDFAKNLNDNGVDVGLFEPLENFRTIENTLSFFESRANSLRLMENCADARNEKYKWVITCRFDLGQIDKYNGYQPQKVSEINFNPNLDANFIYSAMWNQTNIGLADQWFYSNQENILNFIDLSNSCASYFSSNSNYLKLLERGIPFSNQSNDFSNEILLPLHKRTKELKKIPTKSAINNHLLHKFFFLDNSLYKIHKAVGNIPGVARVLYSHTEYSDCWDMYFGQIEKYMNVFEKNYIFVDKYDSRIPSYFIQIFYNNELSYVDRLIECLRQIKDEIIFFEHEDMILYDMPHTSIIASYVNLIKKKKIDNFNLGKFDYIRLINGGQFFSRKVRKRNIKNLYKISKFSSWIFSIQPSLWSRNSFLKILQNHNGSSIWQFESSAQNDFRKFGMRSGLVKEKTKKRGLLHFDSIVYPYIATAIIKGKWNTSEYPDELGDLLVEYKIDRSARGVV